MNGKSKNGIQKVQGKWAGWNDYKGFTKATGSGNGWGKQGRRKQERGFGEMNAAQVLVSELASEVLFLEALDFLYMMKNG